MSAFRLTWQITARCAFRILTLGALFGGIYGPLVVIVLLFLIGPQQGLSLLGAMLGATIFGGLSGALLGFMVGLLVGLLISITTIRSFRPLHDAPRYVGAVQRLSILLGGIGVLIGAPLVLNLLLNPALDLGDVTDNIIGLTIVHIIPALLAGLAIWRASGQVAMWYVRTMASTSVE
jgi:hypothetical protein